MVFQVEINLVIAQSWKGRPRMTCRQLFVRSAKSFAEVSVMFSSVERAYS